MFYNTINLSGDDLKQAVATAKKEQEAIMLIFENTGKPFTPSAIHGMLTRAGHTWLLTSVRRAITDLTTEGKLEMLPNMKVGPYGSKEHFWKLKNK
jgi:hypothetical protein